MWRRINLYLLLPSALLIAVTLSAWFYISTHQEQLSRYVSQQLSNQLGAPLELHKATLGFHPTPTLDFEQISYRNKEKNLTCTIKQLHVGISWHDLLRGNVICAKLILVKPQIYWQQRLQTGIDLPQRPGGKVVAKKTPRPLGQLLRKGIIIDGSIFLSSENSQGEITSWQFNNLALTTTTKNQRLSFNATTDIQQENLPPAHASLQGDIQDLGANWVDAQIKLYAKIDNLDGATLHLPERYKLGGSYNLQVNLHGQHRSGLNLDAQIKATGNGQQLDMGNNRQLPIKIFGVEGKIRGDGNTITADNLNLRYNELLLHGSLQLSNWQSSPQLTTQISSNALSLATVKPYLMGSLRSHMDSLSKQAGQLEIKCQSLSLSAPLHTLENTIINNATFTLTHPNLLYQSVQAPQLNAQLDWDGRQLTFTTSPITIATPHTSVQGPIHITAVKTPHNTWDITTDLSPLSLNLANVIIKPSQIAGRLQASITPPQHSGTDIHTPWEITSGDLSIPEYTILFSGHYNSVQRYQLDLHVPHYDLTAIRSKVKILNWMHLTGSVAGRYSLVQQEGKPLHGTGELHLTDGAISPTFVIAPIHHINAIATLEDYSLKSDGISLILGGSPMQVDATIADLRHPVAQLHATGDGVIARDLVFNNSTMALNNLEGTINIHAKGIDFLNASVDLAKGTHANVTGTLHFRPLLLDLDISAPYANIDEVIALWHHCETDPNKMPDNSKRSATNHNPPSGTNATATPHRTTNSNTEHEFIHINAHIDQGEINGFLFQETSGVIHYQHNQLRIEPLHFLADNGSGSGRVVVMMRQADPGHQFGTSGQYSLLKISGHVNEINSDKVYRQLLKNNGIVTGTLSGDFTIQGPVGHSFLANSQGEFHIDLQRGVLREFKVLSKAFSLLNVAQLFSLNLPDMDRQGMPFNQLRSDITLTNGTLKSDNLVIDSQAMGLTIIGEHDLVHDKLDLIMGVKPLGTIDTVVNNLPVAGWILAGDEKTLISSNFSVTGSAHDPQVSMMPISSVANKLFGIMKRTITLPTKWINNPLKILTNTSD